MNRNIRAEMARYRLTVGKLADLLDISAVSVSNKLNNKTSWTLAEAKKLVDIFNERGSDYTVESLFFTKPSEMSVKEAR